MAVEQQPKYSNYIRHRFDGNVLFPTKIKLSLGAIHETAGFQLAWPHCYKKNLKKTIYGIIVKTTNTKFCSKAQKNVIRPRQNIKNKTFKTIL